MNKKVTTEFGTSRKVFLLGQNEYEEYLWLQEAKWDCGWYWGFGYVETYTNNKNPNIAKDIRSHSHFDSMLWSHVEKYYHHINILLGSNNTVLNEDESWKLSELMKRFYILRETADLYHSGHAGMTSGVYNMQNSDLYAHINTVEMPKIFEAIYELLTPEYK